MTLAFGLVRSLDPAAVVLPTLQRQVVAGPRPRPLPSRAISRPSDPAELAAERTADTLLTSPAPVPGTLAPTQSRSALPGLGGLPSLVGEVLHSAGSPLDAATRAEFEPLLGQDLSHVRVHAGDQAAASADAVAAHAYTVGSDIVLGRAADRRTLAHELVHAVGSPGAVLERYETPEHIDIGERKLVELKDFVATPEGEQWAKKNRVEPATIAALKKGTSMTATFVIGRKRAIQVSIGEVIALMGDFYESVPELLNAKDEELIDLLGEGHIVPGREADLAAPKPKVGPGQVAAPRVSRVGAITRERAGVTTGPIAAAEYEAITQRHRAKSDTFLKLADRNLSHFEGDNRKIWQQMHEVAMAKARQAEGDPATFNEALLIESAAAHFLTDAFATGHMFDAHQLEVEIVRYMRDHPPSPENKELSAYYALAESQDALRKVILKNVHDRLNASGFDVANPAKMKWKSFGDDHLKQSADAGRIAALAVYTSRLQLYAAREKAGKPPSSEAVLALLPDDVSREKITQRAVQEIPEAAKGIPELLFRQRAVVKEGLKPVVGGIPLLGRILPTIIESNLDAVADPLRSRQLQEAQDRARETRMPQPVPQFTIKRF